MHESALTNGVSGSLWGRGWCGDEAGVGMGLVWGWGWCGDGRLRPSAERSSALLIPPTGG
jgi:hypothetical protein